TSRRGPPSRPARERPGSGAARRRSRTRPRPGARRGARRSRCRTRCRPPALPAATPRATRHARRRARAPPRCARTRRSPSRSLEVPAEVDLRPGDLVALEGEDLGVPKPGAVGPRGLVGHEDLVAHLGESLELERRDHLRVRPAALEVRRAVDADIGGAEERVVVGEMLLDEAAVAGLVGAVALARDLQAVHGSHRAASIVACLIPRTLAWPPPSRPATSPAFSATAP